ncbi:hypothetical protein HDU92_007573, partial [Lobulomyces angularis]
DNICLPCPNGAICNGGKDILAKQSFWVDIKLSNSTPEFFECTGETCCDKENGCELDKTCSPDTSGPLCEMCVDGKSKWSAECFECDGPNVTYFVIIVVLAFLVVFFLTFISTGENTILSNTFFTYQVMDLILSMTDVQNLLSGIASISPEIAFNLLGGNLTKCLTPLTGSAYYWKKSLNNESLIVKKFNTYLPKKMRKKTMESFKASFLEILLFVYEPLFEHAITIFDCRLISFDGEKVRVMEAYPDIICYRGNHIPLIILAGILLLVLVIIIPATLTYLIYKRDKSPNVTSILQKDNDSDKHNDEDNLSFIHTIIEEYKPQFPYWIIADFFVKMTITTVSVATKYIGDDVHSYAMFIILLLYLITVRYKVYKVELVNNLDGVSGLGIVKNSVCGKEFKSCAEGNLPGFNNLMFWQYSLTLFPLIILILRAVSSILHFAKIRYSKFKGKPVNNVKQNYFKDSEEDKNLIPTKKEENQLQNYEQKVIGIVKTAELEKPGFVNNDNQEVPSTKLADYEENNDQIPRTGNQKIISSFEKSRHSDEKNQLLKKSDENQESSVLIEESQHDENNQLRPRNSNIQGRPSSVREPIYSENNIIGFRYLPV